MVKAKARGISLVEDIDNYMIVTASSATNNPRKPMMTDHSPSIAMKSPSPASVKLNGSLSAKRKLQSASPEEEMHYATVEESGGMENVSEDGIVTSCDVIVDKFLLNKYAWKVLRQLYINSSGKYMRVLTKTIRYQKSAGILLTVLKSRVEFKKLLILGCYYGETKFLERSWYQFICKYIIYRDRLFFSQRVNDTAFMYKLQKEGTKFIQILKKRLNYQQNVKRPAIEHRRLRQLKLALLDRKSVV